MGIDFNLTSLFCCSWLMSKYHRNMTHVHDTLNLYWHFWTAFKSKENRKYTYERRPTAGTGKVPVHKKWANFEHICISKVFIKYIQIICLANRHQTVSQFFCQPLLTQVKDKTLSVAWNDVLLRIERQPVNSWRKLLELCTKSHTYHRNSRRSVWCFALL